MRLRKKKAQRPSVTLPLVVPGSIRIPRETQPLGVVLTFTETRVSLAADDVDLGDWPPSDVEISPIDARLFSFVAEGDHLVFRPDDPQSFSDHLESLGGTQDRSESKKAPKRRTRWRRPKEATEPQRATIKSTPEPSARVVAKPAAVHREAAVDPSTRESLWLRTIDAARHRGLFGLDRIPVDVAARGQDHQHTFDHGAVASSGPARYICAICGKVKLRR